ncbi:hydroxyacylglutathione hydrolase [Pulveribacter sp.]|uniref:hydroxyacylglutathione hydrolase n=1 Tax=Pulveribacter sp. TaxID=2678893 RepID=UPI00289D6F47|nr:hydroxyacylglutathione hydrolase [Pulveribacter sp.]
MKLLPLPAFADNYIWMLQGAQSAVVVDPGDAAPVLQALRNTGLPLEAILVTHHHGDHTGGVAELRQATGAAVYGPAAEDIPLPAARVRGGDAVTVLGLRFAVIDVPGHTAGHIAYYCEDAPGGPLLFCGDTLFSAGCGRVFEGKPAQMLASLERLAALADDTRVCCAHEYTLSNLKFAQAVEPSSAAVLQHILRCRSLREQGQPTLPSQLVLERQVNPFLRTHVPAVAEAARGFDPGVDMASPVSVFAALRQWKNEF